MFNEMEYVYAVYKNHSFSKAARELFITQPALSLMVKKAETEIGCPIFDRSTVPLTVTREGEFYIRCIDQIMDIQKNLEVYYGDLTDLKRGHLSIGSSSYFCAYVLPNLIVRFREQYPGVSIDLSEGNIAELKRGLLENTLDLIIETALNDSDVKISRRLFGQEDIILCVPAAYAVNQKLQSFQMSFNDVKSGSYLRFPAVPLGELRDTPFLMLKKGNDMYQRGIRMCRNAGFEPQVKMYLDQIMTSFYISTTGTGAVFMRASSFGFLPSDGQEIYYRLGDPLARRPVYIAIKKERYISHAMREFLQLSSISEATKTKEQHTI